MKAIAYTPDFDESGVVMAIVRGRLMRSDDRGESWSEVVNGLGGETQELRNLVVSQSDPSIVYASSTGGELLRSDDGGGTWETRPSTYGVAAAAILVTVDDPDTVLTFGPIVPILARSTDGGLSWERPQLNGAQIEVTDGTTLPDGRIALVDSGGQVIVSEDAGAHWAEMGTVGASDGVRRLVAAPSEGATLFAGTASGELLRSDDGGESFTAVGEGLPREPVTSIAISTSYEDDGMVWVVSHDSGPFRSTDAGATFERVFQGVTRSRQADDLDRAHFGTIALAPDGSGHALLAGFDGLFALGDDGESWSPIETLGGYIAGLDVSPTFADDGTLIVMSYVRGAFISHDGGESWEFANEGLTVDAIAEGNRFAPLRRLHNVHFSPDFPTDETIWGATWVRVIRSRDGGRSWEEIAVGDPPEDSPLRQYVLAPSPEYTVDRTIYAGTRQGEIYRSESEGDPGTWDLLSTLPNRVRSIAPSPAIGEDGIVFVGTTAAVHRSADGGLTWTDTGVENEIEAQGRETDFGIQVAVSPSFVDDGLVLAGTDSGLYRSDDGGLTWDEWAVGPLRADHVIEAVAISPDFAEDGLILASVRDGGLLRSTDGGESFEVTGRSLIDENLIIADFANPSSAPIQFSTTYATDRTIFAYAQQRLLRSTDAGESWTVVRLPTEDEVLASLDPFTPAGDDSLLAQEPDIGAPSDGQPGSAGAEVDGGTGSLTDGGDGDSGVDARMVLAATGVLAILGLGAIVVRRSAA